jgi:hypothetical protein
MTARYSVAVDQLAANLLPALAAWGWGSAEARTAALAVIVRDAAALAAMVSEDPQITLSRQVAHCRSSLRKARAAYLAGH